VLEKVFRRATVRVAMTSVKLSRQIAGSSLTVAVLTAGCGVCALTGIA